MRERVSIVVPSRNEEKNIKECLEALEKHVPEARIIVVDHSEDSTPKIVEQLASKYGNIELVRINKPGKGAALKEGFRRAEGVIVMTDADNSYPAKEIPKMLELLEEADIVIGSRYCRGGGLEGVSGLRKLTGKGYSLLFRLFFGVRDSQSGLKAFRKDTLKKIGEIKEDGFEWDSVFVARAKRIRLRIVEHPITFTVREKESNVRVFRTTWGMWLNFIQLVLRMK